MESFITVEEGVDLFVRSIGAGRPVVVPLACWCDEFDVLASGRRLILYDPRGRGRSTPVGLDRVSTDKDVQDLEAVRASLNLPSISIIGWSYLGGVAARYAMLHPERIERLVMVGATPVRGGEFMKEVMREQTARLNAVAAPLMEQFRTGAPPTPELLRQYWDAFVLTRTGQKPPWPQMRSQPFQYANEQPERVFPHATRAMQTLGDWDWREDARRIQAPVLVIDGAEDILPVQATSEWVAALPNARAVVMEGVGHFPSFEDPDRFFKIIADFLSPE